MKQSLAQQLTSDPCNPIHKIYLISVKWAEDEIGFTDIWEDSIEWKSDIMTEGKKTITTRQFIKQLIVQQYQNI